MPPPVDRSSQNWQISLFPIRCLQDFCCSFAKVSSFCQLRGSSFAAAGIGVQIHPIQFPRICKTAFSHFHIQFKKSHSLFSFCTFAKHIFIFSEFKEESQLQLFALCLPLWQPTIKFGKVSEWVHERMKDRIHKSMEKIYFIGYCKYLPSIFQPSSSKRQIALYSPCRLVGWCHH